jgi:flagellar hook assembly protein FlgD
MAAEAETAEMRRPSPLSASQLLTGFAIRESAFSPDGDGDQDTTTVAYALFEDSPEVTIVVYQSDSVTVVDTLIAPVSKPAGNDSVGWDGTSFDGTPVPEGLYLVTLTARGTTLPDMSATLPVAVDNTPPSIQVLGAEPGVYAPGLFGTPQVYTVTVLIGNTTPTHGLPHLADEIGYEFTSPTPAEVNPVDAWLEPEFQGQDGIYALMWDANKEPSLIDGHYSIKMTVTDKAGHSAEASNRVNVDVGAPDVGFINVEEGADLEVVPDSLYAWTWDRNGVDSVYVKYADASDYVFIGDVSVVDDTSFFAIPLADSLTEERKYTLTFRSKDAVAADTGWVAIRGLQITVDRSAPGAPSLEPFNGIWRSPTFRLRGSWTGSPAVVRLYRNGSQFDSLLTIIDDKIDQTVFLDPGLNVFVATVVDEAKNESAPSNEVRITFNESTGLYIPVPFHPNDVFQLNLSSEANQVTLRLYDLSGDLVVVLEQTMPGKNFTFAWDGKNGDGEDVKKGPLVSVAEIFYADGTKEVIREIFLFEPGN